MNPHLFLKNHVSLDYFSFMIQERLQYSNYHYHIKLWVESEIASDFLYSLYDSLLDINFAFGMDFAI
jgi:hypothetical protein